jgi:hypothetical protein
MNIKNGILSTLALALIAPAAGASVTFTDFDDANGLPLFFDISSTAPDGGDPNTLIIGLDGFAAAGGDPLTTSAIDTLVFNIFADPGFVITKVTYSESGGGEALTGISLATGTMVVGGEAKGLGFHAFPAVSGGLWALSTSFDLAPGTTSTQVVITNSLFAFGTSEIAKMSASVTVEVAPIPIPGAVWLFGSALIGLVAVRRRTGTMF